MNWFKKMFKAVKRGVDKSADAFVDKAKDAGEAIVDTGKKATDAVVDTVNEVDKTLVRHTAPILRKGAEYLGDAFDAVEKAGDSVVDATGDAAKKVGDFVVDTAEKARDGISDIIKS